MIKCSLPTGLLACVLVLPCAALAQTASGATAGNMPSQRIVNGRSNGTGAALTISPAQVRRVQQELNRLGYSAGPVNGSWSQATARALQNFQAAHGLAPSGHLNATVLSALGLGGGNGNAVGARATAGNNTGNNIGTGGSNRVGPAARAGGLAAAGTGGAAAAGSGAGMGAAGGNGLGAAGGNGLGANGSGTAASAGRAGGAGLSAGGACGQVTNSGSARSNGTVGANNC